MILPEIETPLGSTADLENLYTHCYFWNTQKMLNSILPITTARDTHGKLTVAGHNLVDISKKYGTPLYIYDAATVRYQVDTLKKALQEIYPGRAEIDYAAKSYFSLRFGRHIKEFGLGVDVASLGELEMAKKAGFSPNLIHLHGNNKSDAELEAAICWGIQAIVADSLEELEVIDSMAAGLAKQASIWLRITPGIEVDTHPYRQTGHTASKFGLSIRNGVASKAIRLAIGSPHLKLTGLHAHLGSQLRDAEPYQRALKMLLALAHECSFEPDQISPGGGWGVAYTPEEPQPDLRDWVKAIYEGIQQAWGEKATSLPKLIIEPGRWLTARAGMAIYSVGYQKMGVDGIPIVAVDGGMADNPRPALYRAVYSAIIAERPDDVPTGTVRVVGKYCESGDELIHAAQIPAPRKGEHLVIPVAGAYQLSMSSNYNLASRPPVLWLDEGKVEVLQHKQEPTNDPWWLGD